MRILRKIEAIENMVRVNYKILNKDLVESKNLNEKLKEKVVKLEEDNFRLVNENNSFVAENNELKEQIRILSKPKRKYVRKTERRYCSRKERRSL